MNLNLGCGDFPLPGYVNVDARPLPGVDVVADVRFLPLHLLECQQIYAGHILEHLERTEAITALHHWWGRLATDGQLTVVVPDCRKAARGNDPNLWRMVFLGDPSIDLLRHRSCWSEWDLTEEMSRLPGADGVRRVWHDPRFVAPVWWQSAVRAVKR